MPIFNTHEEMQSFIDGLDNTIAKWEIIDNETNEVVEGCESMTDKGQYVWIMENQPKAEVEGEGVAKYGLRAIDTDNADMSWLDSE
jgi:predicted HAD superfamily phosphohydrolase YqeG